MKRIPLILTTLLCMPAAALAGKKGKKQAPAQVELSALASGVLNGHGLFLDVSDEGGDHQSGHTTNINWAGNVKNVASMRRDKSLEIKVRNGGSEEQNATLEWFFVSLDIATGRKHIFDRGTKELSVPPGATNTTEVTSVQIQSMHISKNGEAHAKGSRVEGWIVRLVEEGHVLAQTCSNAGLEEITRDETKVRKLQSPAGLGN